MNPFRNAVLLGKSRHGNHGQSCDKTNSRSTQSEPPRHLRSPHPDLAFRLGGQNPSTLILAENLRLIVGLAAFVAFDVLPHDEDPAIRHRQCFRGSSV